MKDDKIIIKRSKNADTRTAEGEVTKKNYYNKHIHI